MCQGDACGYRIEVEYCDNDGVGESVCTCEIFKRDL